MRKNNNFLILFPQIIEGEYADRTRTNQLGEFRHIRTDITSFRNKPLTKK